PKPPPQASVLVPAEALLALAGAAGPEAAVAFARRLGEAMGRRVAARLSGEVAAAPVDAVVEHLGGELALAGLGSLALERWGKAVVLVVDQSPLGALLEGVLAAAVEAAVSSTDPTSGRGIQVVRLEREGIRARFLLGGAAGTGRVRAWLAEGVPWGEALV